MEAAVLSPVLFSLYSTHKYQISIDHRLLVWAGGAVRRRSLQKVAFAAALPWPLLLSLRPKGVLWWSTPQLRHRLEKVRVCGEELNWYQICRDFGGYMALQYRLVSYVRRTASSTFPRCYTLCVYAMLRAHHPGLLHRTSMPL